ncbi:hypothetical protein [uncultured Cohaesibacter sp.]|uniref:hypothetical protein n=1 Tax=uncultured Cohaesibacter sp. TaxID=1002546 RepID=UPI0029C6C3BF|nr:hypothetical protein [uncultured Cohaesibacter sp.]
MSKKVAIYWPGEYVSAPNELARPQVEESTRQMEKALRHLGLDPYRVEGFIDRPHKGIEKLGHIDDPMIGIYCHWVWGSHIVDGVAGKDSPLLLASNFNRQWPGLVGMLNSCACFDAVNRPYSRIWTEAPDWSENDLFMSRLEEWTTTGRIRYPENDLGFSAAISPEAHATAMEVAREIRRRRIMIMMLGDTSQGMINGYFGTRLLTRYGFTENKIDQAWVLEWGQKIAEERIDQALQFVQDKGITFHWQEEALDCSDFTKEQSREQLRDYLAVLDMINEFKADCLGWQFQLGLLGLRPASDLAEGLFNSTCRPEGNGDTIVCATEADQGNVIPAELLKRLLKQKDLNPSVFMHDTRWAGEHEGRTVWMLCNSGNSGAYAYNKDPDSLEGVHSYRQVRRKFGLGGGTFAGLGIPGEITWARTFLRNDELWMDIGRGEIVDLPEDKRNEWWNGATPQWPLLPAYLGVERDTIMAHYMSNHIALCYGDVFEEMVALAQEMGFKVRIFGQKANG